MRFLLLTAKPEWFFQVLDALENALLTLGEVIRIVLPLIKTDLSIPPDMFAHDVVWILLANPGGPAKNYADIFARGARRIVYETEPLTLFNALSLRARYKEYEPHDIWTYSSINMCWLHTIQMTGVALHLVPPGYSEVYDYTMRHPHVNEMPGTETNGGVKKVVLHARNHNCAKVRCAQVRGFFTKPCCIMGNSRTAITRLQNAKLNTAHVTLVKAWTHEAWSSVVADHCICVNVHKINHCCAEMFRIAPLLSSGIVVVSERCAAVDEHPLIDMVEFVDAPHLEKRVLELKSQNVKTLRARGERARQLFRHKFNFKSAVLCAVGAAPLAM